MITIDITDSISQIGFNINRAISVELNHRVRRNITRVERTLKAQVFKWISSSPAMLDLIKTGPRTLNAEFGLRPGTAVLAVDQIAKAVADSTHFVIPRFTERLRGRIELRIQPDDFRNLLGLDYGTVISEKGDLIEWLNWLLLMGDAIVVAGYDYSPRRGLGRSGGGIMIKPFSFRVNPRFSGIASKNFVTEMLGDDREREITEVFHALFR